MEKEYLEWVARKRGYVYGMNILGKYGYPEDISEIKVVEETAIQNILEDTYYSDFEKQVMIEEVKNIFRDYKDMLKWKYMEVV